MVMALSHHKIICVIIVFEAFLSFGEMRDKLVKYCLIKVKCSVIHLLIRPAGSDPLIGNINGARSCIFSLL